MIATQYCRIFFYTISALFSTSYVALLPFSRCFSNTSLCFVMCPLVSDIYVRTCLTRWCTRPIQFSCTHFVTSLQHVLPVVSARFPCSSRPTFDFHRPLFFGGGGRSFRPICMKFLLDLCKLILVLAVHGYIFKDAFVPQQLLSRFSIASNQCLLQSVSGSPQYAEYEIIDSVVNGCWHGRLVNYPSIHRGCVSVTNEIFLDGCLLYDVLLVWWSDLLLLSLVCSSRSTASIERQAAPHVHMFSGLYVWFFRFSFSGITFDLCWSWAHNSFCDAHSLPCLNHFQV